jgi:glycosyltransferase involved in cell wall biosynthesis
MAFVMSSFEPGGTERQMIELIRRIDRSKWDVHVACLRSGGRWFKRVAEAAPCETFPISSFKRVSTLDRMRDFSHWCRENQFAVVHTVDTPSNIFGLPGAALAGVPVRIGTRRDVNPGRSTAELAMQRAAYACAHVVVANARAAAERLRFERVPARKIAVVPNGLELRPRAARKAARLRQVITVANLRAEKGHDVLIEAARLVSASFPDARFELVGGGPELERLRARVHSLGLDTIVTFSGHTEDVAARLDASDIFVLPSRSEAFPNALLEAMGAGLPVVASAVGGILEMVDDGRTGLLAPAGDARALANRILTLMGSPNLGARLGTAARREVESRFSFERMVAGFERVYLTQLNQRGVTTAPATQAAAS